MPNSPYRTIGGPKRCTGLPRAYKMPYLAHSCSFHPSLSFSLLTKILRVILSSASQSIRLQSAISVSYFSLFCTRGQCPFFFFSYFFCKMLVAILLEMHASVYFIFGIFISIYFCHDLCHAILGKYAYIFCFLIYECKHGKTWMLEIKCGAWERGLI